MNELKEVLICIIKSFGKIIPEAVGALIGVLGALYIYKKQLNIEKDQEINKSKKEEIELLKFSEILLDSILLTISSEVIRIHPTNHIFFRLI